MHQDQTNNAPATSITRNQFGTFGGVFTPCILTILGVIMFMRANFVVGEAGIFGAIMILVIAKSITLLTALSTSAIGTNMQVRGGGAYYLISRVVGPEFGGGIGIALFLAQAVSVPFYVLGFTEAVVQSFPGAEPHFLLISLATAVSLFAVTYQGAGWGIKLQYVIMAILAIAIVGFLGGAVSHFSWATFAANWETGYTPLSREVPAGKTYSFWMVFAIYFPAVTGITAGINMSGDLKNPSRSIPWGTLSAIGVAFVIYTLEILACGGAFDRSALINRPYLVLGEHSLFGGGFVAAGMYCAALSSALGSYMGAPRVLQAVARDGIVDSLRPFAKGAAKGDEPRRALVLTALITFCVLVWAGNSEGGEALNLVAETITMFFLYTYGMLNLAAFVEAAGGNPSFRPRFRFFHWTTAFAGAVGCVAVAFVISPFEALAAIALLAGLVWYIKGRELETAFGDARRGFYYKAIRNNLLRLAHTPDDPKNWRPTCLVFSGNPASRDALVSYAVWFESGRGIVFLANVLVGPPSETVQRRAAATELLTNFCTERDIQAFPVVVAAENLYQGVSAVLQATSIGPVRPNLAIFGWSDDASHMVDSVNQYRLARAIGMSLVVIRPAPPARPRPRRVDVWWRGKRNGSLMVLLALLLRRNWEWSEARIRLLRHVKDQAGYTPTLEALSSLIHEARVEAVAHVVVSSESFAAVLRETSGDADCILMGFEVCDEGEESAWHGRYVEWLQNMPTTVLVSSSGGEDILA